MSGYSLKLSIPVSCESCTHQYVIDPVGVSTTTDIVCPACTHIGHFDQATVDRIDTEFREGIGELDEDIYQDLMAAFLDAPERDIAVVVDARIEGEPS